MKKIRFIVRFALGLIVRVLTIRRSFNTYPAGGTRKTTRGKIARGELRPVALHHRLRLLWGKWYGAVTRLR